MTNFDKIKAMNVEEMAEMIRSLILHCDVCRELGVRCTNDGMSSRDNCNKIITAMFLEQEAH